MGSLQSGLPDAGTRYNTKEKEKLMMVRWMSKNLWNILIWGSTAFFTILYISLLFNQNVWTDEIYTIKLIEMNLSDFFEEASLSQHPPLYYLMAKLARLVFGESLLVQKIVALVPMSLTLVLGALKIRRLFSDRVAFLFIVILGCIPCSMEYAVQVRMYSMALLAVTACGLYAYECCMTGKRSVWFGFVLSAVAGAYLHYFAFVSVIVICGLLFLLLLFLHREKLKVWLLSILAMIVCYLPWFPVFVSQVKSTTADYWIPEITGSTIWGYFQWAFGINKWEWPCYVFTIISVLMGIVILLGAIRGRQEDISALMSMLVPTLTAITGVVISSFVSPIYREQYIFPAIGLFCLFMAIALSHFLSRSRAFVFVPIVLFLLFLGAVQYLETYRQEYKSTLTDQTVAFWEENVGENDIIVYNLETYRFCYTYYFPEEKLFYVRDVDLSQDFDTIWFLDTMNEWDFVPDQIEPWNLQIEFQGHYGIEHNEFDIYKVYKGGRDGTS